MLFVLRGVSSNVEDCEKEAENPADGTAVSVTVPLNPPGLETVTVELPTFAELLAVNVAGFAETEKSPIEKLSENETPAVLTNCSSKSVLVMVNFA